jgi:quercetin dioxygenase-like cupin family protein
VKLSANAVIPRHSHAHNEESFVLEGEVVLDGTLCKQGDYHFAAAGTIHRSISSDSGCTLLIKTS